MNVNFALAVGEYLAWFTSMVAMARRDASFATYFLVFACYMRLQRYLGAKDD